MRRGGLIAVVALVAATAVAYGVLYGLDELRAGRHHQDGIDSAIQITVLLFGFLGAPGLVFGGPLAAFGIAARERPRPIQVAALTLRELPLVGFLVAPETIFLMTTVTVLEDLARHGALETTDLVAVGFGLALFVFSRRTLLLAAIAATPDNPSFADARRRAGEIWKRHRLRVLLAGLVPAGALVAILGGVAVHFANVSPALRGINFPAALLASLPVFVLLETVGIASLVALDEAS